MNNMIECRNLVVGYGRQPALGPISLNFPKRSKIAVLGPNGAGKSTLLKALAGVVSYKGTIKNAYTGFSYTAQRQEVDWRFPVTCREVAEMGLYSKVGWFRRLTKEDRLNALGALAKLGIENLAERPISQLSVGQQQRVFLARSIVDEDADLFLFDEPLAGVDLRTAAVIYKLFDNLVSKGKSVICVHHNLYDAEKYFDHGILINQRLVATGPLKQVLLKKNLEKAFGAGVAVPRLSGSKNPDNEVAA